MGKSQNTQLAIVDDMSEIRESYIDPATDTEITVSAEQRVALAEMEIQIASSLTTLMLGLKRIRDSKLYLLRSDTFDEYLRMIGIAPRTAYRQLQIADTFGKSEHFEELSRLPQTMLLEAAKNNDLAAQLCDGEVKTADGEILTIEEIVNSGAAKLRAELEKTQKGFRNYKKKYEAADEDRKLKDSELAEWKDKFGPENYIRITKKKDALGALFSAEGEIGSVVQTLDSIDSTDVEVIAKLGALIGQIKFAVDALEDKWMPHLVSGAEK